MTGTGARTAAPSRPSNKLAQFSPEERVARGKQARRDWPRSSHGRWKSPANRADPIALLGQQAESRVPELVPIRYGRMLVSPSTFYRGAALIMATDLATTPSSGLTVQLCGDAHLSNFGVYASPERQMLFDINDFDETLPGPWEWDVKRLAASFEIVGRENRFSRADRRSIVMTAVVAYRQQMRKSAAMRNLDVWYMHTPIGGVMDRIRAEVTEKRLSKQEAKDAAQRVAKARTRDSTRVFAKLAAETDGDPRIVGDPPLIVPIEDLVLGEKAREEAEAAIQRLLRSYRRTLTQQQYHPLEQFQYVHLAHKVVGVGSVGTRTWILLMLGRDDRDPLFLQAKEAQASVLEAFVGRSRYPQHGQRVVAGQRLMQAASDIFLGWQRVPDIDGRTRDYYIRQLHDWKGSVEVDNLRVPGATAYARLCGVALARAHARGGDRIAIASYLGSGDTFERAIADFAATYADQNEKDYQALVDAAHSGRVRAETGL